MACVVQAFQHNTDSCIPLSTLCEIICGVVFPLFQVPTDEFSHLLKGLKSGCPPHGGIALGMYTDKTFIMLLKVWCTYITCIKNALP